MKTKWVKTIVVLALILVVGFGAASAYALTVQPEKETYYGGEWLAVSGVATPNSWVTITVTNPNGAMVYADQKSVGADGSYSATLFKFPETATSFLPYGTYTITVQDPSGTVSTTVTYMPPPKVHVQGRVVDKNTGEPIEGAIVTLDGRSTTTDENGTFAFPDTDLGTYTITVTAPNYLNKSLTIEVSPETVEIIEGEPHYIVGDVELTFNFRGLIEELQARVSELEAALQEQNATFTAKLEALRTEVLQSLQAQVEDLTTKIDDITTRLSDVESRVAVLRSRINELETSISDLKGADVLLNTTILAVKGEISSLTEDVATLQSQIVEIRDALSTLANDLASAKADIEGLKASSGALTSALQTTQQQVADLQTAVNGLQASVNVLNSQIVELNNALQNVANTLPTLASKSDVQSLGESVSGLSDITYAALGAGIIAVIIALAAIVMLYRKIQA